MERREFITQTARLSALVAAGTLFFNENALNALPFSSINSLSKKSMNSSILKTNQIQTTVFTSGGKEVKVHAVQTGLISVKKNFLTQKGKGIFTKFNIALDNDYEDFMPIWAWVIEHPEGIIVIDTGDIEEADHSDFYKEENLKSKFNLKAMSNKRRISKVDELNTQLSKLNIKPEQVSKVVLTHLHGDHTDGLKFFPTNEIIVNENEHKHPYGNLPTTYPKWFKPTLVNYQKDRIDYFDWAFPITKSEDLLLVPTPGHTYHHSSVLFKTDSEHILFAGDVSYKYQQILDNTFGGSNINYKKSQKTYQTILKYSQKYPMVYLPSHDENSGNRLINREVLLSN